MRRTLILWATFLPVLALAVGPAWVGLHFRQFVPYLGLIALFATLAVIWLWLIRAKGGMDDDV